jgi:transposase
MGRFIAVDLHKNSFTSCSYRSEDDYKLKTHRVSLKGLEGFRSSLNRSDEVAVESTGNTVFFVREIALRVKRVRIVNPIQFKVFSSSVKKTDEADALTIARFLNKGMIPEVRMRTKER